MKNLTVLLLAVFFGGVLSFSDASTNWQLGFQDPATPYMEGITSFHNNIMFFIVLIVIFTSWLLFRCLALYDKDVHPTPETFTHSTALEVVWTVLPAVILMIVAVPSFALLYSLDEVIDPAITLKVVGHQWYWSYEYSDYTTVEGGESLNFDSYMIPDDDLTLGSFRLLEVDNRIVLPVNTHIRVLVTAADVLHSWAIPSLGVKVDACPGRLNQVSLFMKREGVFYGQCSEICGVNHGFMPIVVQGVSLEQYIEWIQNKIEGIQLVN
uniref:Cytochrome c oxidase subunit 2 n=1 Tax=Heterosigma akashiwo TaxID=2829 RepID=A0A2Z5W7J9_HETAK|nr:cytochrome c oxidase subunit II [Heterosigma akashiwo]|mmetsp:Transcript_52049/g.76166  ORF Transcript_52049/g.76166 Transcript_52049/m.76166 type:complete len:267 (-) Transcript_52049:1589-2389(-)